MKVLVFVLLLLIVGGCIFPSIPLLDEKPVAEAPASSPDPVLIAGPYVSCISPSRAKVCFVTDQAAVSSLTVLRAGFQRTIRGGKASRLHVLDLIDLQPGVEFECRISLNTKEHTSFPLKIFPAKDESVRIAFLNGGEADPERMKVFLEQIKQHSPILTVLLGSQVNAPDLPDAWYEGLLVTETSSILGMNLIHAPDLSRISEETGKTIFPGQVMNQSFVSQVGEVDLIFLAQADLSPEKRIRLDHWLASTLGFSKARWKIVLLPLPLVTSTAPFMNYSLMESFAPLFEKHSVDLVFSSLAPFYHRSTMLGTENHAVSYVSLPQLTSTVSSLPPAGKVTAAQSLTPAITLLDAYSGRLYLSIMTESGEKEDTLVLDTEPTSLEENKNRQDVVNEAKAEIYQKREMEAIVRQAARSVQNPNNPGSLDFVLTNSSSLPFEGMLEWKQAGSKFSIKPHQVPFTLEPGAAARSIFHLTPEAAGEEMPELIVTSGERPVLRQRLLLVPQTMTLLPNASSEIVIDGRPGEPAWEDAVFLNLTFNTEGNPSPSSGARAKIIAGTEALYVTFRCPLEAGVAVPSQVALEHDEPVWKEESVELFIDPDGRGRRFYQFSVSMHGVALDGGGDMGRKWNPVWSRAVEVRQDRYNVEMAIPYQVFELEEQPRSGTVWGIHFTRNDYSRGECEITQAAPTYGPNDRSGLYTRFKFETPGK